MKKNKIAIIFGVTGQDGSYLSELLLEKDYKVIGVKRRSSTNTTYRLENVISNQNFDLIEGDITDSSSTNYLIQKCKPNEIFNLAAQSHVHTSFQQPFYTFQVNALGVANILEAVKCFSSNSKVYQASTSELWGSNYSIDKRGVKYQDENTSFSPNSPYAVSKLAAHELVNIYRNSYNIFACAGIIHNHESPRRGEEFVTRKITKWIADFVHWQEHVGMPESLSFDRNTIFPTSNFLYVFPKLRLGNLNAIRDWSHAKDMVRGMWLMLQQSIPKDYAFCSGIGRSIYEFLDCAFSYIDVCNWDDYIVIDQKFYRPYDVGFLQGRYDLAKKELNWEPQINFKDLVYEMVESDIKLGKYSFV